MMEDDGLRRYLGPRVTTQVVSFPKNTSLAGNYLWVE